MNKIRKEEKLNFEPSNNTTMGQKSDDEINILKKHETTERADDFQRVSGIFDKTIGKVDKDDDSKKTNHKRKSEVCSQLVESLKPTFKKLKSSRVSGKPKTKFECTDEERLLEKPGILMESINRTVGTETGESTAQTAKVLKKTVAVIGAGLLRVKIVLKETENLWIYEI
jgi:hypothetical protein